MNPYDVLGVPRDASDAQIKAAYRARAKSDHPDAGGSLEAFQQLGVAHRILSDADRRRRYDETGSIDDAADRTRANALQKIHQVLGTLVASDGAIYRDLVEEARGVIKRELMAAPGQKAQLERNITKLEALRKRFRAKKGPDFIGEMIEAQIVGTRASIAGIDENARISGVALEILADAEFVVEPSPIYSGRRDIFGASASSNIVGSILGGRL